MTEISIASASRARAGKARQSRPSRRPAPTLSSNATTACSRSASMTMPPASPWRGRSYCRTRETLIRCTRAYCGAIDPAAAAVLAGLPTRVEPETPEDDRAATLKAGRTARDAFEQENPDEDTVVLR